MNEQSRDQYQTPRHSELDFTKRGVTLIPEQLASRTRVVVCGLGLYTFAWPLLVARTIDSPTVAGLSIVLLFIGYRINRSSFKHIPWTSYLCLIFPLRLARSVAGYEWSEIARTFLSNSSLVLICQTLGAVWGVYAALCVFRCHMAHGRLRPAG
ncbi:hypothetical protein [Rhodopirellula europaea]|jgi:hypothetical protein|uniref:Membrane protein n=1 Tax=Rhodopirellula europaea SH398 TaxID=1263868 RepID=M5RXA0_9BACT|nr:hypothetical protein [Rhodopirellula europaea]EMI23925.1 membrane protein [Rhodopirellula europaea SH398]MCR9206751.1 hypothetical protein [bacterium]